jgi:ABC-2 type transport system ATP-binding protein/lipopolysaccharide transport system ATP-binding protein
MASIDVADVSLDFPIYDARARSLKNTVLRSVGGQMSDVGGRVDVQALRHISLRLRDGDRLAIVGHNGAGKTTLLKVLAGIYEPTGGSVSISGTVSSLTDVTMGMDVDATGTENILMRCVFLGMTYREARTRLPEIEAFTELGPYLSLPIRTYSTGMLVRLGFAATTASRPEILIMDEMIGAGDMAFAEKVKARIEEYVSGARILILASHNTSILKQFCTRAILLEAGTIKVDGTLREVLDAYNPLAA